MTFKLLTEPHLEFISLTRGFTCSYESTLIKMPHCWKSHVMAQVILYLSYDDASGSEITPCNKICKPLVVYRFTGNVITFITTLRTRRQNHNVFTPEIRFQRICHMINRI